MSTLDINYYPPLGSTSPIAGTVGDYVLGYGLDESDIELYSTVVETDVLCFANYFEAQVIIIKKRDLLEETYDLKKIFAMFAWNFSDVITEENFETEIDNSFPDMDIIRM